MNMLINCWTKHSLVKQGELEGRQQDVGFSFCKSASGLVSFVQHLFKVFLEKNVFCEFGLAYCNRFTSWRIPLKTLDKYISS